MARLKPEDVELWASIIRAAVPAGYQLVELTVMGVAGIIKAIRRARGESEPDEETATVEATAVLALFEQAKQPWQQIRNTAEHELARTQGPSKLIIE